MKNMNWINNVKKLLQFLNIFVFSLILIEVIGLFVFDNRYSWDRRYLYLSNGSILNENSVAKPFWKYQPNSTIRSVAVYQHAFNPVIEYDCKFNTNAFGFIDTGSIRGKIDFLVLGDSFTEGQGGCPWLTRDSIANNSNLSNLTIANGGLQGAGLLTFEQVLNYFEANTSITNLVIVAISNDFKRGDAQIWPTNTICYLQGLCNEGIDLWHHIPIDISNTELISDARDRNYDRRISFFNWIINKSFVYRIFLDYKIIFQNFVSLSVLGENDEGNAAFDANFEALERIRLRFPELTVILVSMRDEVGILGRKNQDTIKVEQYLSVNNFNYRECQLSSYDFMPLDGHPNEIGYEKIFNCLSDTIIFELNN